MVTSDIAVWIEGCPEARLFTPPKTAGEVLAVMAELSGCIAGALQSGLRVYSGNDDLPPAEYTLRPQAGSALRCLFMSDCVHLD